MVEIVLDSISVCSAALSFASSEMGTESYLRLVEPCDCVATKRFPAPRTTVGERKHLLVGKLLHASCLLFWSKSAQCLTSQIIYSLLALLVHRMASETRWHAALRLRGASVASWSALSSGKVMIICFGSSLSAI